MKHSDNYNNNENSHKNFIFDTTKLTITYNNETKFIIVCQ